MRNVLLMLLILMAPINAVASPEHLRLYHNTTAMDDFLSNLKVPPGNWPNGSVIGNVGCCDHRDCVRVGAEWRASNHGWAVILPDGTEMPVPPDRIINQASPDGEAYACFMDVPIGLWIKCFVPPAFGT